MMLDIGTASAIEITMAPFQWGFKNSLRPAATATLVREKQRILIAAIARILASASGTLTRYANTASLPFRITPAQYIVAYPLHLKVS